MSDFVPCAFYVVCYDVDLKIIAVYVLVSELYLLLHYLCDAVLARSDNSIRLGLHLLLSCVLILT